MSSSNLSEVQGQPSDSHGNNSVSQGTQSESCFSVSGALSLKVAVLFMSMSLIGMELEDFLSRQDIGNHCFHLSSKISSIF
ncbi:hypothetical protein BDR03DRAFT_1018057 [Suillus americanus]|nr:hypothetical protein BDR03DRAFT_1018057 [Suillus americanus]